MNKQTKEILSQYVPLEDINEIILEYSNKSIYNDVVLTLKEFYSDHYIENIYDEDSFKDYFFNNCNFYYFKK